MKTDKPHHEICKEFNDGFYTALDNESHGEAIFYEDGQYFAGYSKPFKYCPACGEKL